MPFVDYNLACPKCTSSDGYAIDDAGWGTCFACGARTPPDNDKGRVVLVEDTSSHTEPPVKPQGIFYSDLSDRKLTKDTCTHYGVGWKDNDLYFPVGSAHKVRVNGDKQFRIEGDFQSDKRLFGQDRFPAGQKYIIVTEGEFDAMAAYQMMQGKTPCVSVRNGSSSAVKDCKENYEYLDSFEHIVFCFDGDDPGKDAQKKCCELFAHKAKSFIHSSELKDANDYLMKNKTSEFVQGFWRAQEYVPDGIVSAGDFLEALLTPIPQAPLQYPFDGLNKMLYGIRPAEMVTFCAGSGLGKSTILREIVSHILRYTDDKIGLAFLEETPERTLRGLVGLEMNKPIHLPEVEYDPNEVVRIYNQYNYKSRVFLWNHFGSNEIDSVLTRMRHFVKAKDCRYLILDHLSILVSIQHTNIKSWSSTQAIPTTCIH